MMEDQGTVDRLACPLPIGDTQSILMAHGGGGRLTQQLIEKLFAPAFANDLLAPLHDGAVVDVNGTRIAFTTDSFVVRPITFPGGDIGKLAVYGTVNDLAMCGARPLFLSAGFILEEGLALNQLSAVVLSMQRAAREAGVLLVTGDTKVVDRGKGDQIYINTSGIGIIEPDVEIDPRRARPGDRILINGEIAAHGISIMSVREGIEFETQIETDSAPLHGLVRAMLGVSPRIRVLRDATRGGVATVLNEIARSANVGIEIHEDRFPVRDEVQGACEILGLDPLYVANEGVLVAFVPEEDAETVMAVMKAHPLGKEAAVIGEAVSDHPGRVVMTTAIGGRRMVEMMSGEQLPRIC